MKQIQVWVELTLHAPKSVQHAGASHDFVSSILDSSGQAWPPLLGAMHVFALT